MQLLCVFTTLGLGVIVLQGWLLNAFNLHWRVYLNENLWGHELVLVDNLQYAAENLSGCITWTIEFNSFLTTQLYLYVLMLYT